jgi:hypothetical protein
VKRTQPSPKNAAQLERLAKRSIAQPHSFLPPLPEERYEIVYLDPP